jgi:YggT family protein
MGTRVSPDSYAWGASARERAVFTVERILDFGFSVLYGLLTIRFLLAFFQASAGAAFYGFVHSLSQPFFAPFQGLFGTTLVAGHPVVWALLAAMVAFAVLHALLRGVLRLLLPTEG